MCVKGLFNNKFKLSSFFIHKCCAPGVKIPCCAMLQVCCWLIIFMLHVLKQVPLTQRIL